MKQGWFSYTDLCLLWDDPRFQLIAQKEGLEWIKVRLQISRIFFYCFCFILKALMKKMYIIFILAFVCLQVMVVSTILFLLFLLFAGNDG